MVHANETRMKCPCTAFQSPHALIILHRSPDRSELGPSQLGIHRLPQPLPQPLPQGGNSLRMVHANEQRMKRPCTAFQTPHALIILHHSPDRREYKDRGHG
jgi:hypothetical protein